MARWSVRFLLPVLMYLVLVATTVPQAHGAPGETPEEAYLLPYGTTQRIETPLGRATWVRVLALKDTIGVLRMHFPEGYDYNAVTLDLNGQRERARPQSLHYKVVGITDGNRTSWPVELTPIVLEGTPTDVTPTVLFQHDGLLKPTSTMYLMTAEARYHEGDSFRLYAVADWYGEDTSQATQAEVYVVLDILGVYYFLPGFSTSPASTSIEMSYQSMNGFYILRMLDFEVPDGFDVLGTVTAYAAVYHHLTGRFSNVDWCSFTFEETTTR